MRHEGRIRRFATAIAASGGHTQRIVNARISTGQSHLSIWMIRTYGTLNALMQIELFCFTSDIEGRNDALVYSAQRQRRSVADAGVFCGINSASLFF